MTRRAALRIFTHAKSSRGTVCPRFALTFARSKRSEGAGKAGCQPHPQPRAQKWIDSATSFIHRKAQPTSGFPCTRIRGSPRMRIIVRKSGRPDLRWRTACAVLPIVSRPRERQWPYAPLWPERRLIYTSCRLRQVYTCKHNEAAASCDVSVCAIFNSPSVPASAPALNELDRIAVGVRDPGCAQPAVEKIVGRRQHRCAACRQRA